MDDDGATDRLGGGGDGQDVTIDVGIVGQDRDVDRDVLVGGGGVIDSDRCSVNRRICRQVNAIDIVGRKPPDATVKVKCRRKWTDSVCPQRTGRTKGDIFVFTVDTTDGDRFIG